MDNVETLNTALFDGDDNNTVALMTATTNRCGADGTYNQMTNNS